MTPDSFIRKWKANSRAERAASQEHYIDLCRLLDEPTPNEDPFGSTYAFEKGATKATGRDGWADVWRRGCFAWEYKGKHKDLDAAHAQLLLYAGALENPPLLIVSDIERIVIRTNWNGYATQRHELLLDDLARADRRALLKSALSDPDALRPSTTRQALTERAAADFAAIATRLRDRGHDPHAVAHFLARLAFCAFADDIALLPKGLFDRLLTAGRKSPAEFEALAGTLFMAMARRGGRVGFDPVPWFNGGLFNDAPALPLEADDIATIQRAAALDWADIDPSILGTLFERGLDPDKRTQLGAHYTDRDKIEALIDPVVRRPLLAEWEQAKTQIEEGIARAAKARKGTASQRKAEAEARAAYTGFLERLRRFRVLDPACGSGNFLYLSLLALKDIELRAGIEAEGLGLQRELLMGVGPEQVLGLELNPYAAELARVSVWIGHIQWARKNGLPPPENPVLRPLDTIECRDAVLAADGSAALWPDADAIVGNPPFLGSKWMLESLGADYTKALRAAYASDVPATADLVCYWIEKARRSVIDRKDRRVGFVATNMIRGPANRQVMENVVDTCTIFDAWSDEPWILDGADVRVSMFCFSNISNASCRLNGVPVDKIHADLSAGAGDFTRALGLTSNFGVANRGIEIGGPFAVDGPLARQWLRLPVNTNGKPNSAVLKPAISGRDVAGRMRDRWLIDFGQASEAEAAYYPEIFGHLSRQISSSGQDKKKPEAVPNWWRHRRSGADIRGATANLKRFIATILVAKHRFFVWVEDGFLPETRLVIIARDDDTTFGIVSSSMHTAWTLKTCQYHGVGNDPIYTPGATFETFPFPEGLTPNLPAASYATDPRAVAIAEAARALVEARDRWLNPPELVNRVPEVVPGFPDRVIPRDEAAARVLRKRTLTNLYNTRGKPEGAWLDGLHRRLDAAVAAAYGWPEDISTEDALARLLALNYSRAASQTTS